MESLPHYISLDVGTMAVKAVLFDSRGTVLASASHEYMLETPAEDIVECDAEQYWSLCKAGIAQVLATSRLHPRQIRSVGVCSEGETLIVLDREGKPLRRAIVWMDNRSRQEAVDIENALGRGEITGQLRSESTWPVSKILWLKRYEPRIFNKAHKFMLVEDYIMYRLTGEFWGECSLYSSSFMLDIARRKWWDDLLDYVGVSPGRLVTLTESGKVIGTVARPASKETGLDPETFVVMGAMDQAAAVLGAGAIDDGMVTETTGAALAICATVDSMPAGDKPRLLPVQCHAIPGKYLLIGWCPTGGMALKWLRDTFFTADREKVSRSALSSRSSRRKEEGYTALMRMAQPVPPGSQGLVFLPYLAGVGSGELSDARGVYCGLGLHHDRAHFVRSLLEGVACILRKNIELMGQMGLSCTEIRSLGGGAKSRVWNQIKADITGKPLVTMKCPHAAALGTAMLQARAVGTYSTLREAEQHMVHRAAVFEPDAGTSREYENFFLEFLQVKKRFAAK